MVRRGLQTQGEWAAVRRQPIYFVPPKLAATMPQLVKGRRSAEQYDAVKQVHDEIERWYCSAPHAIIAWNTALRDASCDRRGSRSCTIDWKGSSA